ncbi:MAG: 16S rRNA processing protein RimM [Chloroflexi bacterium]|nr:16S rRNA processing protein RimM [Chloroflexota bacterium]
MPASSEEQPIVVGRIRSAWGVRGDVSVEVLSDAPNRFAAGSELRLKGNPTRVEHSRKNKRGILVKLDTVADRTQAESLRGEELTILPDQVEPLPDGMYYHFQILGMQVLAEDGENLGVISEIIVTGSNDVYVVHEDDRRDILIPALPDVVLDVDLQASRMTISLPDGLA